MKTKKQVLTSLGALMLDERLWYKNATIDENAILALVQVDLRAKADTLCWVLGITFNQAKELFPQEKK